MNARCWLPAAATVMVCLALASWPALQAAPAAPAAQDVASVTPPIRVGKNIHVSADNSSVPHYEVISCANPVDTRQMLAAVMIVQNAKFRTIVYRSTDGGDHWSQALVADDASGDPTCVFAPDGSVAYFGVLAIDGGRGKFLLYRSTDGGASWGSPIEQPGGDRPYLTVDDTRGRFHGSLYTIGVASTRSLESRGTVPNGTDPGFMTGPALFASRNNGATFLGQLRVALSPQYALGVSNPVVLADGSVAALLGVNRDHVTPFNVDRRPARSLTAMRSTPGGTALREGVRVSDWYLDSAKNNGTNIAALAVDRSNGPFAGRLYAVWLDNRSGRSQVLVSWSDSNGDAWSVPVVADDDLSKADPNAMPDSTNVSVVVNQAGVVGVTWGDRREHRDNLGWTFRFAASFDGGDTFTPSVKLASAANSYDRQLHYPFLASATRSPGPRQPLQMGIVVSRFFYSSGDTVSMTIDQAGHFHPMWCDNRTGLSQLWTTSVAVTGSALRNGSEQLADLDEVTHRIEASVDTITYDPLQNRGELVVRLKNISPKVIAGPIKVRVLGLSSQLGAPMLVQDKHAPSDILTFDIDALRPNERSSARPLRFSIASHHRPIPGHDFVPPQLQFLNMRFRVFARHTNNE